MSCYLDTALYHCSSGLSTPKALPTSTRRCRGRRLQIFHSLAFVYSMCVNLPASAIASSGRRPSHYTDESPGRVYRPTWLEGGEKAAIGLCLACLWPLGKSTPLCPDAAAEFLQGVRRDTSGPGEQENE